MATIKAPYNFVPFNRHVVSPHWIDQISHDIPFVDGLSGNIEVKLKAESPIFVRDGIGQKQAKDNYQNDIQDNPHLFSQYKGRYFIPGTSIKGMIRNVLEILSFGSMEDKVNDHKYALRDLSGAMKEQYLKEFKPDKIYCGWLKKGDDNSYSISDCGLPGRISHKEIDEKLGTKFSQYFSIGGDFKPKKDFEKSAKKKYTLLVEPKKLEQKFAFIREDVGRKIYTIDSNNSNEGTLVFTGQSGFRKQENNGRWTGHHLEFIFFKDNVNELIVPENAIRDFFFAYYEHDKPKWSEDWKEWRIKLAQCKSIPIFFQKDKNGEVKSMGLSYLYKLPYKNSVLDAITHYQGTGKRDLSQAIFGYVDKHNALKGRVHIGHAFASHAEVDGTKEEVLSGPKASYYPNYIRQVFDKNGGVVNYKTFMEKDSEIAGWKRYPVHANGIKHNQPSDDTSSAKILTKFIPLKAGAEFTFSIRYHNLRPVELGAILSSLTFHNTSETFHSIGMAKPLGYGKVSLTITNSDHLDVSKYLGAFETYMNSQLQKEDQPWHQTDQVTELVTMAQDQAGADFGYMNLNDHRLAKDDEDSDKNQKSREALDRYSKLVSKKALIATYSNQDAVSVMKDACDDERKRYQHANNVEEVVEMTRLATKEELKALFAIKKDQLLARISARREAVAQEERVAIEAQEMAEKAERKEEFHKKAQSEGPGFDKIDIVNWRTAKENLIKAVEIYGKRLYKQTDIKKVIQLNPNGYLPAEYQVKLVEILRNIYSILPRDEREKWNLPFQNNATAKKVAEWIGKDLTEDIKF